MIERWELYDTRTEQRMSIATYPSREYAEGVAQRYRERDARGGRPDLHEAIPFMAVRKRPLQ